MAKRTGSRRPPSSRASSSNILTCAMKRRLMRRRMSCLRAAWCGCASTSPARTTPRASSAWAASSPPRPSGTAAAPATRCSTCPASRSGRATSCQPRLTRPAAQPMQQLQATQPRPPPQLPRSAGAAPSAASATAPGSCLLATAASAASRTIQNGIPGWRPTPVGSCVATRRASDADKKKLVDGVDCFIFDCDGVIWRGDSVIDGVPETLDMLRAMGKRLVFVTNNSTKSRAGYLGKFTGLGLNVNAEEIYSSSYAAAAYLESINFNKKVYVIGETGILEELDLKGIAHLGGPDDADKTVALKKGEYMEHDEEVGAVVVGFDRFINYYKIQYATLCIRENPGCLFIATNRDAVTHLTDAQEWAGNGSMVGAIAGSTKREPITVGKPAEFMLDNIAKTFGLQRQQICMVGDRLDTDILFGKNGGLTTCLVLSGVTDEATLLSPDNTVHPDYYMSQLSELLSIKNLTAANVAAC